MTAKTPRKVHLRLRFQNLGKPRTAGLCGRAAGACDCGPLSCAKIERPSPLEKPSCKVRLFVQNRSRKYRQKVTATTLFQITFHRGFSTSPTNGPRSLSRAKASTHSALLKGSHTTAHTPKEGAFRMGRYHYPRHELHVHEHPRAGYQNGVLCRFWVLAGGALPKNAESLRDSDALMRVAVPKASRPRWAA